MCKKKKKYDVHKHINIIILCVLLKLGSCDSYWKSDDFRM